MILGRKSRLWTAAVAAILNASVVVFGVHITLEGLAALNSAAFALVALIANESDPTTAVTAGMQTRLRTRLSGGLSSGMESSPTNVSESGVIPTDITTTPTAVEKGANGKPPIGSGRS